MKVKKSEESNLEKRNSETVSKILMDFFEFNDEFRMRTGKKKNALQKNKIKKQERLLYPICILKK